MLLRSCDGIQGREPDEAVRPDERPSLSAETEGAKQWDLQVGTRASSQ